MTALRFTAHIGPAFISSIQLISPLNAALAGEDVPFTKTVALRDEHVSPDSGNSVVRAFILTRSWKQGCLVTLSESNNAVAGLTIFCGVRAPSLFGGQPGIMLTAFFPGPVTGPLALDVTVHQDGAKTYGAPVACLPADGC